MKHHLILSIACLSLLAAGCKPDGEISGTVTYTDYYDGCIYPAGGATLYKLEVLPNGSERSVSSVGADKNGKFCFPYVEDGNWRLRAVLYKEDISYEGFSETVSVEKGRREVSTSCHLHQIK